MIYLILLAGLLLRLISINQSLWLDEATTALVSKMSAPEMFSGFLKADFHPPLYYLLMKFWTDFFGYSELALRLPSVIFGLGTVYLIYLIGTEVASKKVGLFAALFLATSGLHVYYSQEARMYSMASFFVAAAFLSFVKILKRGGAGDFLMFSLLLPIAVFSDYMPFLMIPVFFGLGMVFVTKRNWWKKFLMSHIVLVAGMMWWLPHFLRQLSGGVSVESSSPLWWELLGKTSLKNLLLVPVKFTIGRVGIESDALYFVVAGTLALVYFIIMFKSEVIKSKYFKTVWMWLVLPVIIAVLIGLRLPVLSYFRLLFVLPAFCLILASGVLRAEGRWKTISIIFVLLVNIGSTAVYLTNPKYHREDWRSLVNFVDSNKSAGSITIFPADSNMEAYRYYSPGAKVSGPNGVTREYSEIWLMRYLLDVFDPGDQTRLKIEKSGYRKDGEYSFRGMSVWKYTK
jgi:mannosyltransferase